MKTALYLLAGIIVIFMALVLFNWMCLSDAQAQDPTPTAEAFLTHSFGYRGVPIIPVRNLIMLGVFDYRGISFEYDPENPQRPVATYLGHDIVAQTIYQRYVLDGVCFVLSYPLDVEARRGEDGMPHPVAAYEVRCD